MPNCLQFHQARAFGKSVLNCQHALNVRSDLSRLCSLLLLSALVCVTPAVAQVSEQGSVLIKPASEPTSQQKSQPTSQPKSAAAQFRIIGGEPVFANTDAPWIVALTYNNTLSELVQRQFCGGSLIADQWVLTAAHCLYDRNGRVLDASDLNVTINAANLRDPSAQELAITNIIVHPQYDHNGSNPHSDLALLELATASGIEPVALSNRPSDELVGLNATVMGWGAVDYADPSRPKFPVVLHSVDVPIVSLPVCNGVESYAGALLQNQLCAGLVEGGKDSCVGDSGGPMVVTIDGKLQQAGIVSFGYGCALPNFYGVYTDVPYYIGWINQYVFVGEPGFEPEQLAAQSGAQLNTGEISSNSDTASLSWLVLLLGVVGFVRMRLR